MRTIKLIPSSLSLQDLEDVYRNSSIVEVSPEAREKVNQAAEVVDRYACGSSPVYGVNTGFGKLANTRIDAKDTGQLQRNLILSHCCGVGDSLPDPIVRMIIVLKLNSLGRGASGVRWSLIQQLQTMLANNILPVIPSQGSVGASGDLAPLAHLTAAMIGEGDVRVRGEQMTAKRALKLANMEPVVLAAKEGLGMINGTQVSTALALAGLFDCWHLLQSALLTGAIASDAMMASTVPFRQEIHALRGQPGQIDVGYALREMLVGSAIRESHREDDVRVQDPYCMRCQPQVMGACVDMLRHVAGVLKIEANAVTDNPLIIAEQDEILSGGNFHAEPVAFAADQIALAIAEIGSITERRIATMVDPTLNYGLPAFLSPDPGLNSGFMIAEVTAAALMAENKQKAMPCSVDSTPTSANQEDHVSMACHAGLRLIAMNQNLANIVGIELLVSAQGIEFRKPLLSSQVVSQAIAYLRESVPILEQDRYLAGDIEKAASLVKQSAFLSSAKPCLPCLSMA